MDADNRVVVNSSNEPFGPETGRLTPDTASTTAINIPREPFGEEGGTNNVGANDDNTAVVDGGEASAEEGGQELAELHEEGASVDVPPGPEILPNVFSERLPDIRPAELKIAGRCVCFSADVQLNNSQAAKSTSLNERVTRLLLKTNHQKQNGETPQTWDITNIANVVFCDEVGYEVATSTTGQEGTASSAAVRLPPAPVVSPPPTTTTSAGGNGGGGEGPPKKNYYEGMVSLITKDTVLLTDVLRYESKEKMVAWQTFVSEMKDEIAKRQKDAKAISKRQARAASAITTNTAGDGGDGVAAVDVSPSPVDTSQSVPSTANPPPPSSPEPLFNTIASSASAPISPTVDSRCRLRVLCNALDDASSSEDLPNDAFGGVAAAAYRLSVMGFDRRAIRRWKIRKTVEDARRNAQNEYQRQPRQQAASDATSRSSSVSSIRTGSTAASPLHNFVSSAQQHAAVASPANRSFEDRSFSLAPDDADISQTPPSTSIRGSTVAIMEGVDVLEGDSQHINPNATSTNNATARIIEDLDGNSLMGLPASFANVEAPMGRYKFVTFSRRHISGVYFCNDHPPAGVGSGRKLQRHPFLGVRVPLPIIERSCEAENIALEVINIKQVPHFDFGMEKGGLQPIYPNTTPNALMVSPSFSEVAAAQVQYERLMRRDENNLFRILVEQRLRDALEGRVRVAVRDGSGSSTSTTTDTSSATSIDRSNGSCISILDLLPQPPIPTAARFWSTSRSALLGTHVPHVVDPDHNTVYFFNNGQDGMSIPYVFAKYGEDDINKKKSSNTTSAVVPFQYHQEGPKDNADGTEDVDDASDNDGAIKRGADCEDDDDDNESPSNDNNNVGEEFGEKKKTKSGVRGELKKKPIPSIKRLPVNFHLVPWVISDFKTTTTGSVPFPSVIPIVTTHASNAEGTWISQKTPDAVSNLRRVSKAAFRVADAALANLQQRQQQFLSPLSLLPSSPTSVVDEVYIPSDFLYAPPLHSPTTTHKQPSDYTNATTSPTSIPTVACLWKVRWKVSSVVSPNSVDELVGEFPPNPTAFVPLQQPPHNTTPGNNEPFHENTSASKNRSASHSLEITGGVTRQLSNKDEFNLKLLNAPHNQEDGSKNGVGYDPDSVEARTEAAKGVVGADVDHDSISVIHAKRRMQPLIRSRLLAHPYLLEDLERARMFTRRYIIHTSMGNNPTKITLRAFVASRAPWPNPNDTLLLEIAKEELETIMQIENDIYNRNDGRGIAAGGGGANGVGAGGGGGDEAAAINVFARGVMSAGRAMLVSTGIPTSTTVIAVSHIMLSIGFLLYSASAFSTVEKFVIAGYLNKISTWVVVSAAVYLALGAVTGFHSLKMKVPISYSLIALRAFFIFIALTALTFGVVLIYKAGLQMTLVLGDETLAERWESYAQGSVSERTEICNFMMDHQCTGYTQNCYFASVNGTQKNTNVFNAECNLQICTSTEQQTGAGIGVCGGIAEGIVLKSLVPLMIIAMICVLLTLIDAIFLIRIIRLARFLGG